MNIDGSLPNVIATNSPDSCRLIENLSLFIGGVKCGLLS